MRNFYKLCDHHWTSTMAQGSQPAEGAAVLRLCTRRSNYRTWTTAAPGPSCAFTRVFLGRKQSRAAATGPPEQGTAKFLLAASPQGASSPSRAPASQPHRASPGASCQPCTPRRAPTPHPAVPRPLRTLPLSPRRAQSTAGTSSPPPGARTPRAAAAGKGKAGTGTWAQHRDAPVSPPGPGSPTSAKWRCRSARPRDGGGSRAPSLPPAAAAAPAASPSPARKRRRRRRGRRKGRSGAAAASGGAPGGQAQGLAPLLPGSPSQRPHTAGGRCPRHPGATSAPGEQEGGGGGQRLARPARPSPAQQRSRREAQLGACLITEHV